LELLSHGPPARPRSTRRPGANRRPGSELAVLLVEDEPGVAAIAQCFLESLGYRVSLAKDGPEALAVVARNQPLDILFTDVILPGGMNGREVADGVLARRPNLKLLFSSGYPEDAISHKGRLHAGVVLVPKPYRSRTWPGRSP
jgi:CheY-like chemotaxis protein